MGEEEVPRDEASDLSGVGRRSSGKWVCEVRGPNKKSRIWLGTFTIEKMAARTYDVAAIALCGLSICLNFADSVWKLPVPASTHVKDIQKATVEAAKTFGQLNSTSNVREKAHVVSTSCHGFNKKSNSFSPQAMPGPW